MKMISTCNVHKVNQIPDSMFRSVLPSHQSRKVYQPNSGCFQGWSGFFRSQVKPGKPGVTRNISQQITQVLKPNMSRNHEVGYLAEGCLRWCASVMRLVELWYRGINPRKNYAYPRSSKKCGKQPLRTFVSRAFLRAEPRGTRFRAHLRPEPKRARRPVLWASRKRGKQIATI